MPTKIPETERTEWIESPDTKGRAVALRSVLLAICLIAACFIVATALPAPADVQNIALVTTL